MLLPERNIGEVATIVILLMCATHSVAEAKKSKEFRCPIGFTLAHLTDQEEPICHRLKGPEHFSDKFVDCSGNLYTTRLYKHLGLNTSSKLWAEYKSLYSGGPFIDWSYTDSTGELLINTYDVKYNDELGLDEEFCTVIMPDGNLTAVGCDEEHARYCFVKPYEAVEDLTEEGCESINGWRFWSPRPTCLTSISGVGGGSVRATWRQAKDLCVRRGGTLLQRGWRYSNNPLLNTALAIPVGIMMTPSDTLLWLDVEDGNSLVPDSEWSFKDESFSTDTSLVSLRGDWWHLVNESYIFYDVICEKSIHLEKVNLELTLDKEGQLILRVNDTTVDDSKIWCYTDSVMFYPSKVKTTRIEDSALFKLEPLSDGYYWCIHVDSKNFTVSESNKQLFIRHQISLTSLYSVKIRVQNKYEFGNLEKLLRVWSKKLADYISVRHMYVKANGDSELYSGNTEEILHKFKGKNFDKLTKDVLKIDLKLKRLFLDGKTALFHAQINSDIDPIGPGMWEGIEVIFMKPAYYCKSFKSIPLLSMGKSIRENCTNYTCVGDFNEGVQWVASKVDECITRLPISLQSSVDIRNATSELPPTTISAPNNRQEEKFDYSSSSEEDNVTTTVTTDYAIITTVTTDAPLDIVTTHVTTTNTPTEVSTVNTPTDVSTVNTPTDVSTVNTPTEVSTVNTPTEVSTVEQPYEPTTPRPPPSPPTPPTTPNTTSTTTTTTTTMGPPTPEESLQNVMDNLEQLLQDETAPVPVDTISDTFNQVDELLDADTLEIPGQFLHLLDQLGSRVDLNGSQSHSTIRNNIAILLADSREGAPVRGLQILARDNDTFTQDAFQLLTDNLNSSHLDSDLNEVVVHLPESVAQSDRRISFVVFRNDRAFHKSAEDNLYAVNSRVLSVNVENITQFLDGEVINLHFRPVEGEQRNNSRTCAYWHFYEDGSGIWSQDGCTFISSTSAGVLDTCQCTHLTHFAEVLVPMTVFSENNEIALEILSIIGCVMSISGVLLIGLTAALFRSWRRDFSNKIWLQLCMAILILAVCFLIIVFASFKEYTITCMLVGVLLHYAVLASFCWMLVAAVLSYRRLVLVFTRDASHKLLRASAFSWGAPCAIVGVLLSVAPHAYAGRFEEMTPSGTFCYPTGLALWLAVYAPISLMLLANWTLFALIVRSVFASKRIQRHGDTKEAMRCATVSCLLVFLFGLPWIFGLFASNIIGAYLFTLTATFQGFVLFIFFVAGNKKTRDLWLNKLKIKQTRKVPVTSSTNGKSSGGWRGGSVMGRSLEATMSKPRSLASSDESRFS